MGSRIECFWVEPTDRAVQSLRRFTFSSKRACGQNRDGCDASVTLGEIPWPLFRDGRLGQGSDDFPHDDPNWPKVCSKCGEPFSDADEWQNNIQRLFKGAPDGKLYSTRTLPPGAMYDATWWPRKGPDGITLCVCLPPDGGYDYWLPDSPSKDGNPWTRTGTIPRVTVTPSILTPRYHGFLTDGYLVSV